MKASLANDEARRALDRLGAAAVVVAVLQEEAVAALDLHLPEGVEDLEDGGREEEGVALAQLGVRRERGVALK